MTPSAGAPGPAAAPASGATVAPRDAAPASAGEPSLEGGRQASKSSARRAAGALEVQATPFALVKLDGRALGDAEGVRRFAVPAGPHVLVLEHPRWSTTQKLTVTGGQTVRVTFDAMGQRAKVQ